MNRPDDEVAAQFIVKQLDDGAENLAPATRERLALARRTALARYPERTAPVFGLAWAFNAVSGRGGPHTARYLVAVAALVLGLAGIAYWQTKAPNDFSDIDLGLLTDDLPIDAYLDKGFDSWLKRVSR